MAIPSITEAGMKFRLIFLCKFVYDSNYRWNDLVQSNGMNLRNIFLRHVAQTSPEPMGLEISEAEGLYLIDKSGKKFMDLISGIGVSVLGHQHPAVVKAVKDQVDRYMHTLVYGEFILSPQVLYAQRLTQQLDDSLDCVYFVNSGAEATEGAMKLARRYTGRAEVISCYLSYHGSTTGAMALNSDHYFTRPYRPFMTGIRHIRFNEREDLGMITEDTAAVIIEPVQAERGIYVPDDKYLHRLRQRTRETGTLLVFDEIQTGFGRTGHLFAHQKYGIIPDIMLIAKGMGGGMPIGAFISAREIMQSFTHSPVLGHLTTFGGHPVNCAAALATLETLLDSGLIKEVAEKERILRSKLVHKRIIALRTAGLWAAIEVESSAILHSIIAQCRESGLILDWFLFNEKSLRLAPPLIITREELDMVCDQILAILDKIS